MIVHVDCKLKNFWHFRIHIECGVQAGCPWAESSHVWHGLHIS